jgi:hypothetical protein
MDRTLAPANKATASAVTRMHWNFMIMEPFFRKKLKTRYELPELAREDRITPPAARN